MSDELPASVAIQMFYVAESNDDDNRDLFVIAENLDQAVRLWREYYDLTLSNFPTWVFRVPCEQMLTRKPRALGWHQEVQEIYRGEGL